MFWLKSDTGRKGKGTFWPKTVKPDIGYSQFAPKLTKNIYNTCVIAQIFLKPFVIYLHQS